MSPPYSAKPCRRCGTVFQPVSANHRYCSPACKGRSAECRECGRQFIPSKNAAGLFCSPKCFYDNTVPVGTVRLDDSGYTITKVPRGTPGANLAGRGRRNWMWTHRWVMQQKLGRPLARHETVHHINGQKDDNDPSNLQLRQGKHGQGARFVCLDCGSHNVAAVVI